MYKYMIFLLFFLFELLEGQMISRTKVAMGTFVTLSLPIEYKSSIEDGFSIIDSVEMALSSYDTNATIYRLNHQRAVELDAYSYEALRLCQYYYKRTNHSFNIAIGSITKELYRFGEDEHVPLKSELENSKVDFSGIHLSKKRASLSSGVVVDLGGMGKGFGVDKVASYFLQKSIKQGIIAASGDIRCLDICSIEIQNPFSEKALASFTTKKRNSAISTSGNYNRYVHSPKNNHLINPQTKASQERFVSITLISNLPNSDIDAYATAASVMELKEAYDFLDSLELGYVVLEQNGLLRVSQNISEYTDKLLINDTYKENP